MSKRRDDGLSIAVWENSPWRAFFRFRDPADTMGQAENGPQPSRLAQDAPQTHHQDNTDDIREIFGRAMDAARSKKAFASAAQIRKDVMRSEARLMAEDNRSWGSGRYKWNRAGDVSAFELEEDTFEEEDDGDSGENSEPVEGLRQPMDNLPGGPFNRNNSIRITPSSCSRRGTATGSGAAEDVDVNCVPEWSASVPRTPTRLQISVTGNGEPQPSLSPTTRSPPVGPPGSTSPLGDASARARAARSAATAQGSLIVSTTNGKLLHVQATNMPVRRSLDIHASRKPLSPTGPPSSRRSNSFDGVRRDGSEAAAAVSAALPGTGGLSTALANDRAVAIALRERRAATSTGASPAIVSPSGLSSRTSGGDNSTGGLVDMLSAELQRDSTMRRNRSRRARQLGDEERRTSGSGAGGFAGGGYKHPPLGPSTSGRLLDVRGPRLHALPKPSKTPSSVSAASAGLVATRPSGSTSQLPLSEARKHPLAPVASVEAVRMLGGHGGAGTPGHIAEGRSILGRLRGLFTPP
ncbi:hypothetical protein Vretimale_3604 [Volvox reticuliferus]|uniref:Uncharacterized protein n=1 Tax=Volvox reticuliferus TaxID=1737510 RepID=A0A8J4C2X9_9CHLO|nr:hypothetical protein Vretifemale_1201 [Volvox reticuliferus]GIL98177.1 hypothetical protein Vretimale_3604 [Volvox reticuliferus]